MDGRTEPAAGEQATRVGRRWVKTTGGRAIVVVLMGVLLVGAALFVVNHSSLPERLRTEMVKQLTDVFGVPVSIEAVQLGIGRLTLHDVVVETDTPVRAERIAIGWSVRDLGRALSAPVTAMRSIELYGLEAAVPDELMAQVGGVFAGDGETAAVDGKLDTAPQLTGTDMSGASSVDVSALLEQLPDEREIEVRIRDGRIANFDAAVNGSALWQDGRLHMQRLELAGGDWTVTLTGAVLPQPDVYARLVADDVGDVLSAVGVSPDETGRWHAAGEVVAEAWLDGNWQQLEAWGRIHVREGVVAYGAAADDSDVTAAGETDDDRRDVVRSAGEQYGADDVFVRWTHRGGDLVQVRMEAHHGPARLVAEGDVGLADGRLQLTVDAADIDLPLDVPVLARWDIVGRADFAGTLTGTVAEPVLRGSVASDGGRLFGQPFSSVQGFLELSHRQFAFDSARIAQGTAAYYLEGHILFGSQVEQRDGELQLVLRTDNGRLEALTSVLGWDVPAAAALAGTLKFVGPLGSVGAEGDVTLSHGTAFGQSFDRLAGQFRYGDGQFAIDGAEGTLRGGTVRLSGGGPIDDRWEMSLQVSDVPLQALYVVRDRLPAATGVVNFDGVVFGEPGSGVPRAEGTVSGRYISVGSLAFADAAGRLTYDGGGVRVDSVRLERFRGGTYTVTGSLSTDADSVPLDLTIDVADESLAHLLSALGWSTPVPLAAGRVDAAVHVTGTTDDPEAHIRVNAPDLSIAGRRVGLGLELHLKDGRIEVDQWDRFEGGEAAADVTDRTPLPAS